MMNTFTKTELVAILKADRNNAGNAHYSDDALLAMLGAVSDNFTATIEPARGDFAFNRGSLAECIVKSILYGVNDTFKTSQGRKDLDLRGVKNARFGIDSRAKGLEVKFATNFAAASASEPSTKWVLLITEKGVYNVRAEDHKGRYTRNGDLQGVRNEILSELFGLSE